MNRCSLLLQEDPQSGQPRLSAPGQDWDEHDLRDLEPELRKVFDKLASGRFSTWTLKKGTRRRPGPLVFRVQVRPGVRERCPTLLLEYQGPELALAASAPTNGTVPSWTAGVLADLEKLGSTVAVRDLSKADRLGLQFQVEELVALGQHQPAVLLPLLLAGYAAVAARMCQEQDPERATLYVLGARAVDQLYAGVCSEQGVHLTGSTATKPAGWLRRTGHLLYRLLAQLEEDDSARP